jgi:hypothetical protein
MLTVICNKYNGAINADLYITDKHIFDIFNGQEFYGCEYDIEKIEELMDKIVELSQNTNIVLHTFNPSVLNFLTDEQGIESVCYANKNGELVKFFSHDLTLKKLQMLGVGETISDTRIDWLEA